MKHLLALALLVVVVDRTWSECCAPSQWEGHQALFGSSVTGGFGLHATIYESVLYYSYDADNDLKAFSGNLTEGSLGTSFRVVFNFTEGMRYGIYPEVGICLATELTSEFKKACVPDEAKLLEETYIGVDSASLPVKIYRLVEKDGSVQTTVTETCDPVDEVVVDPQWSRVYTDTFKFYDLTLGIADRKVFSVPDYCKAGSSDEKVEGLHLKFLSEKRIFGI